MIPFLYEEVMKFISEKIAVQVRFLTTHVLAMIIAILNIKLISCVLNDKRMYAKVWFCVWEF